MKYLFSFVVFCLFYLPTFAQQSTSNSGAQESEQLESNVSNQGSNPNVLIKSLSPIKTVSSNKFEAKTKSKSKTEKQPQYNKEADVAKIETYIRKIELHIENNKANQDSNLEIKELKVLLTKLNSKLSALK